MRSVSLIFIILGLCSHVSAQRINKLRPKNNSSSDGGTVKLKARVRRNKGATGTINSVTFEVKDPSGGISSGSGAPKQKNKFRFDTDMSTAGVWEWRVTATETTGDSKSSKWMKITVGSGPSPPSPTSPNPGPSPPSPPSPTSPGPSPINAARAEILALVRADTDLRPKFVRLGFHDCVGGCDGCVDLGNADNTGLLKPIDALAGVVAKYVSAETGITRADIWALAAVVGAEDAQRRNQSPATYPFNNIGRVDCSAVDGKGGPHRDLPGPDLDTHAVLKFFLDGFGFSTRETVTLMGAHTIGTLSQQNSGFDGPNGWTNNNSRLDIGYYDGLIGGNRNGNLGDYTDEELFNARQWNLRTVDNSGNSFPDRHQWENNGGNNRRRTLMLNADIAMVRDISGHLNENTGEVTCRFKGRRNPCPMAETTFDIMAEFKFDLPKWLQEFRDVMVKMLLNGYSGADQCDSPPCKLTLKTADTDPYW